MLQLSIAFLRPRFSVPTLFLVVGSNFLAATVSRPEPVVEPDSNLVSRTGPGDSHGAALSAEGRHVAFVSVAPGLVEGSHNGIIQVYLRDREEQTTVVVSRGVDGMSPGNSASTAPRISADGRWVLFQSRAENLVDEETGGVQHLYVWDRTSGVTRLVSVNVDGTAGAESDVFDGQLTPDGRWVLFESGARDLVPEPTSGFGDVFVRDLVGGATHLVSVDRTGTTGGGLPSRDARISDDGRYVTFVSVATNLVHGIEGPPYRTHLYRRDLHEGVTELVNVPHDPSVGHHRGVDSFAMSAQGRYVVFRSESTNLVANDFHTGPRLFRRDMSVGETRALNLVVNDDPLRARRPVISADGQWVAFETGDESVGGEVYVWHAASDTSQLVSVAHDGVSPGRATSHSPALSVDGRWITFVSDATNLVNAPTSGAYQVYQRDLLLGETTLVSVDEAGKPGARDAGMFDVTPDGRTVAFESADDELVAGDRNRAYDVFVREMDASQTSLISALPSAQQVRNPDGFSAVSRQPVSVDGRLLVFATLASNLGAVDTNETWDVYLRDLEVGTNRLISVNPHGAAANGSSRDPVLSADGRHVVFISDATDLAPGVAEPGRNLYLHDIQTGATTLIAAGTGAAPVADRISSHWISADGSRVVYLSTLTNLVQDASFPYEKRVRNVYLYDHLKGANQLVSRSTNGLTGAADDCDAVLMSLDGQTIVFTSRADNLVADSAGFYGQVYVHSVETGATRWVHAEVELPDDPLLYPGGHLADSHQVLTPDGRWLVAHYATNTYVHDLVQGTHRAVYGRSIEAVISPDARFVALQPIGLWMEQGQLVVIDVVHGAELPVTVELDHLTPGNKRSHTPRWSADSRFLVFASRAPNLVADDVNNVADVFLRDLVLRVTVPLSVRRSSSQTANRLSSNPMLGADGWTLLFESGASDLDEVPTHHIRSLFLVRLGLGDSDGDGMDDDWEIRWFGDLTRDGTGDYDGDGVTDLDEFRTGTDPIDEDSVVRVSLIEAIPSGAVRLIWPSVPGHTYVMQAKADLGSIDWENLPGSVTATGTITSVDLNPESVCGHRYYRVLVTVP
jgi:Tol biopolymer transport system component